MYNGVGLPTPRGSGTSGHVQRNCAAVYKKEKSKHSEESKPDPINREPNKEILEHAKKREIEVKCLELSDALEEQGYTEEEIETKVDAYRKVLLENYNKQKTKQVDEAGRPVVKDSHQSMEAQHERNAKLRDAFGLDPCGDTNSKADKVDKADNLDKADKVDKANKVEKKDKKDKKDKAGENDGHKSKKQKT